MRSSCCCFFFRTIWYNLTAYDGGTQRDDKCTDPTVASRPLPTLRRQKFDVAVKFNMGPNGKCQHTAQSIPDVCHDDVKNDGARPG